MQSRYHGLIGAKKTLAWAESKNDSEDNHYVTPLDGIFGQQEFGKAGAAERSNH
jgi:hypothetical protein